MFTAYSSRGICINIKKMSKNENKTNFWKKLALGVISILVVVIVIFPYFLLSISDRIVNRYQKIALDSLERIILTTKMASHYERQFLIYRDHEKKCNEMLSALLKQRLE